MKARVFSAFIKDVDKRYVVQDVQGSSLISHQDPLLLFGERSSRSTPFAENIQAQLGDGFMPLAFLHPETFLRLLVSSSRCSAQMHCL
jgi:hypothetical protein